MPSYTMSQAIPQPSGRPALADSPTLQTPSGSPSSSAPVVPHSFENRLNDLLAHFDSGTHEFCRKERETPEEKAAAVGEEHRKPLFKKASMSFLSTLSLSRPLPASTPASSSATPAATPTYNAFPKGFPGLSMTTGTSPPLSMGLHRASTSPPWSTKAPPMERASSSPTAAVTDGASGASVPPPPAAAAEGKRRFSQHHFDPSREPKLLGLL